METLVRTSNEVRGEARGVAGTAISVAKLDELALVMDNAGGAPYFDREELACTSLREELARFAWCRGPEIIVPDCMR
jgi:hypothetical protein